MPPSTLTEAHTWTLLLTDFIHIKELAQVRLAVFFELPVNGASSQILSSRPSAGVRVRQGLGTLVKGRNDRLGSTI